MPTEICREENIKKVLLRSRKNFSLLFPKQYKVLQVIGVEGIVYRGRIAKMLKMSKKSVGRYLKKLEEMELVRVEINSFCRFYTLTEKGKKILEVCKEILELCRKAVLSSYIY